MRKAHQIPTISVFSGGGGLDLGFAASGYNIKVSVDVDPFSCKTHELNRNKRDYLPGGIVLNEDIANVSVDTIREKLGKETKSIQVLIGGPPCQAFSVFGRRCGLDDPRGSLIWEYLRMVKELRPKVFVFENVAGLKTIHNGQLYTRLIEDLSCNGTYTISDHNYEVAHFGIPQFRNRIFFIGVRDGRRIPPMAPTHSGDPTLFGFLPLVTVGQVLRNMPEPNDAHDIPNHKGRTHSARITERYRNLAFGERDHHTRINKLDPNRPSFTIIVGSDKGGGKGHVHPYTPREVTPRESARMQTFPDWWEFHGNGRHVIRQVGNAVPPLFAAMLAGHISKHVFGSKDHLDYIDLINKLDLTYLK